MARQRDYAAEYAARNARSLERFGVTYNEQRGLIARTAAVRQVDRATVASSVRQALAAGVPPEVITRITEAGEGARRGDPDAIRELNDLYDIWHDDPGVHDEWFYYHA